VKRRTPTRSATERWSFIAARELECLHALHSRPPGVPVSGQTIALAVGGSAALRATVAWALAEDGDLEGARAALGPPAPDGETTYSSVVGRCLRAGVLARLGDVDGVRGLLHLLEPHLGVPAIYGSIYHYGVVDHFYALALEAVGHDGAAACATRAAELNERLQCRPWARRSRELAARLVAGKPE
jgi:hypothetical protein